MVGWDEREVMVAEDFIGQLRQALANVAAVLDAAGGGPEHLISLTIYVTDKGEYSADLVIYSATKYIGGHSDVIAGVVLGSEERMSRVKTMRTIMGSMAGRWTGWLLMRSLETLKLRMTSQMKNARYVAAFLAEHPQVVASVRSPKCMKKRVPSR